MSPLAKHAGTPDACPTCLLAADQFARREFAWQHAVAQFADQSGVDITVHTRDDLELLIRAWARSKTVVQMDARLFGETRKHPNGFRFRGGHGSAYAMGGILTGILICFIIICTGIWRFFT